MADHLRDQILANLKTTLTGLTTTGGRVYADRTDALAADEVPGLTIVQGDESCEYLTMHAPRSVRASFDVDVTAYDARTAAQADARKRANTIAKEVQTAIAANLSLTAVCKFVNLVQTSFDLDSEGDSPSAMARMRYQVTYCFYENAPDTPA